MLSKKSAAAPAGSGLHTSAYNERVTLRQRKLFIETHAWATNIH